MYDNIEFVICCGGESTRNFPHSKGIPHKCLMPFGDVRLIDYVLKDITFNDSNTNFETTYKCNYAGTYSNEITLKQAFLVGCSQAFAVFPGFSRSGTTILAGRLMGIDKEAITKFTFLLSLPIIAGATVLKVTDLTMTKEVIIGIVTSFVVGILSIKFLLNYIKKHDFSVFAFYRIIIAIIIYIKLIWF